VPWDGDAPWDCPEGASRHHSSAPAYAGIGHPRSPDSRGPDSRNPAPRTPELWPAASGFIRAHHAEERLGDPAPRLAEAYAEIAETGTYRHTERELTFGARVAWRNANRCIGRLYWNSLHVRDRRHLTAAEDIAAACTDHLRGASQDGRIRPLITVFAPDAPDRPGPRIWNEQLIRYAGYVQRDGRVVGDPRNEGLTALARRLGWRDGDGTPFDVLPLIVQGTDDKPRCFDLPPDAVLEVPIEHEDHDWWAGLRLRWHAVPALSTMCLEIGGICYQAAPFNGWYMGTEIGARNLADVHRYDVVPVVARRLGLDTASERSLWRDQVLVELNIAVLHSFDAAGVTMADHHTESHRFLTHLAREERAGRITPADWSWIVPPISGAATPVFHRYYENADLRPNYVHHPHTTDTLSSEV
jgi:nitric-oxide synthase